MTFRVLIKWCKHDWQDGLDVVTHEITEVLVVPEVKSSFGNLKVISGCSLGNMEHSPENAGLQLILQAD